MADRIDSLPAPARRFLRWAPIERLVATVKRSGVLRGRAAFVARELLGRGAVADYRMRDRPLIVPVRHGTSDAATLDEVFLARDYAIPDQVRAVLASVQQPLRVLDLGANAGYFGAFVLGEFPEARIVAFEPDPDNADTLRRAILANDRADRWELVEACAGTLDGRMRFLPGQYSLSREAREGERGAIELPAADVLPHLGRADLAKVDIEGAEWPIIADPRLAGCDIGAIVLEYHPDRCPGPDAEATARHLLEAAGFCVGAARPRATGHGVLWAWKPK
jgi:FkbM family methyltransferase